MSKVIFTELATKPPAPSAGQVSMYVKTDEVLYIQDSSGTEIPLGSSAAVTSLTGDVTGTGPGATATTVQFVGGSSAANVHSAELLANAATAVNTANTIVKRDASGNFVASTITAALNGNATTATTATNFSGALSGDVTGTQSATVVALVGGSTAANVHLAELAANAATATNTASTIVKRDASGNFAANIITAALNGNATTATNATTAVNFTGALSGDVTGTQSATAIAATTVTGKVLTGYTVGSNTAISATDSILLAFEKTQGQINAVTGSGITALTGDVSATGPGSVPATVNSVGGSSAANVHSAELAANAATAVNTVSTIVKRDSSGNFAAGTITANLTGLASNATTAVNFSGALSGDVTGTQSATAISNATVTGKLLTGYAVGSNTPIAATDSILLAFGKTQAQLNATTGAAITSLTGDVTATGPGAAAATLATVNSNVGTFGSSTSIPTFTVNAKGLMTAASSNVVIAPAGTLTGTTLASNVVSSSLTSVGTVTTGTWQATPITGSFIATNTVANSNLAQAPANTLKGNNTAGIANEADLTVAQVNTMLGTVTSVTASGNIASSGGATPNITFTGTLPIASGGTNSNTALNNNRIMVSSGSAIVEAAALTNGQLLIGSTGAAPVAAAITAGSGISVTNAAGSITIATTGLAATTTKTANYTILTTDSTIFCDTSGGAFTLTLPSPTAIAGKLFRIVDTTGNFQSNNLTLARSSTEKIEGLAASKVLQTNWGFFTVITNGTDWFIG